MPPGTPTATLSPNSSHSNQAATKPQRPQRVLACVLCQQRKVKCNRKFPCENCLRAGAQCVPATLVPRQRRRRFPERELLARIRGYEALLRQHHIGFEPLHPPTGEAPAAAPAATVKPSQSCAKDRNLNPDASQSPELSANSDENKGRRDLWPAISQKGRDSDDDSDQDGDDDDHLRDRGIFRGGNDIHGGAIKNAWDHAFRDHDETDHHLLFGSPVSNRVDLITLHPEQTKIFRLWQIYLDNVDPLLKVTHTPSLQARIVEAVGDLANLGPPLEALLFSIYCVAILSLDQERCRNVFGSKKDLLAGYRFACRQALLNCRILLTSDHDCLVALYLYLVSIRSEIDPRSLSSMLAVAIRIAQRLGYHKESENTSCATALEAEMRRRLWWALVTFDSRICEVILCKSTTLTPTWDCRPPLNLSDFELLPGTKNAPEPANERPTEALFVVVRSELGDFVRHCPFHLSFIDPLMTIFAEAKGTLRGRGLRDLQKAIEETHLRHCDPDNPLHLMTIWTARGFLAKNFLLEHCSRHPTGSPAVIAHSLTMLDCDTKLLASPLTRGFRWHTNFHFPFLAYACLLQYLKKEPQEAAERIWEAMSENYDARGIDNWASTEPNGEPFFALLSRIVVQAWEARETFLLQQGNESLEGQSPPRIVVNIRARMERMMSERSGVAPRHSNTAMEQQQQQQVGTLDMHTHISGSLGGGNPIASEGQAFTGAAAPGLSGLPGTLPPGYESVLDGMDISQFWPTPMGWGLTPTFPW
ncbi:hypothetical protein VTI74DRAFT_8777 [Chaetomium olivicolor]